LARIACLNNLILKNKAPPSMLRRKFFARTQNRRRGFGRFYFFLFFAFFFAIELSCLLVDLEHFHVPVVDTFENPGQIVDQLFEIYTDNRKIIFSEYRIESIFLKHFQLYIKNINVLIYFFTPRKFVNPVRSRIIHKREKILFINTF
jgi:hypothetical protein